VSQLEQVLRELESATAVIAEAPLKAFAEAKAAMDRRQWALADLSELVTRSETLPDAAREDALRRLNCLAELGAATARQLLASRREAIVEWNRWSHIYRGLGGNSQSKPERIDCRG